MNKQTNKYSISELVCFRDGNIQYIPKTLDPSSREYKEIVENAKARGFEVKDQPK